MERRDFLKWGAFGGMGLVVTASNLLWQVEQVQAAELPVTASLSLSPDTALQRLMEGNQRFVQHQPQYPDQSQARLQEVAQAQHPFATILSCADSRVPAEIIFDQGIGDIFDVRIAGNIATPEVIGSIEYAVALLNTPLLMVLGHERCGAVTAAVQNEPLPGDISTFVKAIKPVVAKVKYQPGNTVDNAVIANVHYQIQRLKRSPLLSERLQSGKLKIVGGRYDLDTGSVGIIT
ncbi:carbonic anhydrase [Fischerella thermalis CCMEE 5273]|jgi:carbonic anhydrase|uniref:Carbonic anhydrase n=2 Tax=Fischerella TaxID=1190 RepID=G6FMB5_9CYAN|nr:carbonic anhydrase [Fischerella thermalis]PMB07334.1 carbonic anhydrase [Fischerella thermalis CCMEE 5328]PMB08021.1 carbonic anhydrase [Fischerella thermalis CCMEE 5273]EHC19195.1 carbonic anhydrase [Fischerella thermalis JSC-11]MBF1990351.1 carbonic anhydrase [Fischerella thermalis M58_A2018_009]MBF2060560.1 carbonic anhydrase [Fischerella thermalis M66_A2018_004]